MIDYSPLVSKAVRPKRIEFIGLSEQSRLRRGAAGSRHGPTWIEAFESLKMGHSKSPHRMPPARNRLEALYSDVVQQLEQLQFPNLRKTAKQYFQSTGAKGWIRSNSKKSTETKHLTPHDDAKVQERLKQPNMPPNLPEHHRSGLPHHSVNSECRAFPKHWIGSRSQRSLLDRGQRQETASEVTAKPSRINKANSPTSSIRKVKHLGSEPGNPPPRTSRSSSEIGCAIQPLSHTSSCKISSLVSILFKYQHKNEFHESFTGFCKI